MIIELNIEQQRKSFRVICLEALFLRMSIFDKENVSIIG